MSKKKTRADIIEASKAQMILLKDTAMRGYDQHEADFLTLEQAYIGTVDERQRTSLKKRRKSSLEIQIIKPKVMKVTREIMKSFFGGNELAKITPENSEDKDLVKALSEELKDYARTEKFYTRCKPSIRNQLVYGTSVSKVYWANNNVRIENCSLADVWIDPYAQDADSVKYVVHRITSLTIGDIKRWVQARWDDRSDRTNGLVEVNPSSVDWTKFANNSAAMNGSVEDVGEYARPEMYEIYRITPNGWTVSTMMDNEEFMRLEEPLNDGNPFIISQQDPQFVGIKETPVRGYGAPFIDAMIPLQKEYAIRRNQQIDAIDMQLNMRLLTTKNNGLREEDLNSQRKKLEVSDPNMVVPLPTPRIDQSFFDTDKLESEMQEISGVTKYSQGINDKANLNQTATGMSILAQEGSGTIDDVNRSVNESFFTPIVHRIVHLIYKYKESERFANVTRLGTLKAKILIDVGTGSTNKEMQLNNIDNAIIAVGDSIEKFRNIEKLEEVDKYAKLLDSLNREKLKILGFGTLMEEIDDDYEQQQQAAAELGAIGASTGAVGENGAGGPIIEPSAPPA